MNPNNPSILCVDDEPNILRSLHWMLHKEFNVMTAPDGASALELLRKHDFDVIVSDQRMPGMIGSEFLRQACQVAPRAMRILLTGYSDMQALLKSINEGEVFRFVTKPWRNEELSDTVREAARIARSQPPPAPMPPVEQLAAVTGHILVLDDDPQLGVMIEQVMAPGTHLCRATTVAEAVAVLGTAPVSVLVSETRVGQVDTTPLLKLLKQSHPEIVSMVLAVESDADTVVNLINQGQIYRFIPKPVKPVFLKIMLASALQKHAELKKVPGIAQRHAVQQVPEGTRDRLLQAVAHEAARVPVDAAGHSFFEKIGLSFKRLFAA
jgi:DNA-binding NtrC family response regulator